MDLKKKVKELPSSPGVYLMKDSLNTVIYVGKSKNLRNRVGSYFINSKSHSPKVIKLVKNLKDFDYIITDTEFEAYMLECSLIRKIKPVYNRQMNSPKRYCYIRIKMDKEFQEMGICYEPENCDNNLYFGPYRNKNTVEKGLNAIKEHFRILCTNSSGNASGCIKYARNQCIGMCTAEVSKEHYSVFVERTAALLKGTDLTIIDEMEEKMNAAAASLDFEEAAKLRDNIRVVKQFTGTANIISFIEHNENIALVEPLNNDEFKFFLIRHNKILFKERYQLSSCGLHELKETIISNILSHFPSDPRSLSSIERNEIDEMHIIYNYLKNPDGSCKYITIPCKWIKKPDKLSIGKAVDEVMHI